MRASLHLPFHSQSVKVSAVEGEQDSFFSGCGHAPSTGCGRQRLMLVLPGDFGVDLCAVIIVIGQGVVNRR